MLEKVSRTGELEFFNPLTEIYESEINLQILKQDFTGLAGDEWLLYQILQLLLQELFILEVYQQLEISGALTTGIMEYTRYKLGQNIYGINKDISNDQLLDAAFRAAGVSAGASVLGVIGVKIIKGVNNLIKGRFVKGNDSC